MSGVAACVPPFLPYLVESFILSLPRHADSALSPVLLCHEPELSSGPLSLYLLVEVRHWWAKKEAPEGVQMRGGKTLEQGTRGAFIEALPVMERVYVVLGRAAGSI